VELVDPEPQLGRPGLPHPQAQPEVSALQGGRGDGEHGGGGDGEEHSNHGDHGDHVNHSTWCLNIVGSSVGQLDQLFSVQRLSAPPRHQLPALGLPALVGLLGH